MKKTETNNDEKRKNMRIHCIGDLRKFAVYSFISS
jgi:hypothetical protein